MARSMTVSWTCDGPRCKHTGTVKAGEELPLHWHAFVLEHSYRGVAHTVSEGLSARYACSLGCAERFLAVEFERIMQVGNCRP